jgi:hypothetical protein
MLELGLLDSKMSQFPQSLQAISAIYTAKKYITYNERQHNADSSAGSQAKGAGSNSVHPSSVSTLILKDLNCSQYQIEQVKSCAKCFNQLATLIQKSKL